MPDGRLVMDAVKGSEVNWPIRVCPRKSSTPYNPSAPGSAASTEKLMIADDVNVIWFVGLVMVTVGGRLAETLIVPVFPLSS